MTLLNSNLWLSFAAPRLGGAGKAADGGYPSYNIELLPETADLPEAQRMTLAVAGFSLGDLAVSIEAGQLVIRGKQREEQERDYLHRGIATRQFKRSFPLANGVEVHKAELHNGLLTVELLGPRRETRVLKVGITTVD
jgi:HSP20 family molecular chaperone IbpA